MIAAVLLIAFTMAVAAILTAWVTTFTEDQTEAVSNQSENLINCQYAGIDVFAANYDSSNSRLDVTVNNAGTVDLANVTIYAFRNADVQGQSSISNLNAGALDSSSIEGLDNKPDRVRLATEQCPAASAEETDISG